MRWLPFLLFAMLLTGCVFDTAGLSAARDGAVADPDAPSGDDGGLPADGPIAPADGPIAADASLPLDGHPGDDADGDGIVDGDDNCVDRYNPGQDDEDADGLGDLCDNCPAVSNVDQANQLEIEDGVAPDEVGDACDPRPWGTGDTIAFFDGFNGDGPSSRWGAVGDAACQWTVDDGRLVQSAHASCVLYVKDLTTNRGAVSTRFTIESLPTTTDGLRYVGLFAEYDLVADTGYACLHHNSSNLVPPGHFYLLEFLPGPDFLLDGVDLPALAEGDTYAMQMVVRGDAAYQMCTIYRPTASEATTLFGESTAYNGGGHVAVRTLDVGASVPFVIVYELGAFDE